MKKTLSLPGVKSNAAQYAKALPKPFVMPAPQAEPVKSRLFDPEIIELPKRKKPGKVRQIAKGKLKLPLPAPAKGTMNRPDKSELRNNLTFNWC